MNPLSVAGSLFSCVNASLFVCSKPSEGSSGRLPKKIQKPLLLCCFFFIIMFRVRAVLWCLSKTGILV